jgi:hypothetical protein
MDRTPQDRTRQPRVLRLALVVGAALGAAAPADAQSVWDGFPLPRSSWSVFSGATYSDNVTRAPVKTSDTTLTIGATGSLFKDEGRLYANVRASAWYEYYLDGTFDSELLGSLGAQLRYAFVPERFYWTLENTYGQTTQNTFQPASPGNRVNSNFFSTGPDVTVPFGGANGLRIGGRFELNTFDDPGQLDEERVRGNLELFRRFAPTVTGSIVGSLSETEFRDGGVVVGPGQIAEGYDIRELFGRLEARRARQALSAEIGVTEVEQRGETESSPLYRLNYYRRLSPSLNLNLGVGQEYRSGSSILQDSIQGVRVVNNQVVFIPPGVDPTFVFNVIADSTNRNQPVKYRYGRASLDLVRTRTTFSVAGTVGEERVQFSGQRLDRDTLDLGASVSRRIRPNVTGTASVAYYDRQFVTLDGGDEDLSASLQLSWQYTSRLAFNVGYRYSERDSDLDTLFTYDENMLYVGLTYGPPRQSMFATPGGATPAAPGASGMSSGPVAPSGRTGP